MSISKNRVFPKSKSKQQLLNNLEKLKKFKPLIKHSIDTFEKPRKSLLQRMELHGEESGEDEYEVIAEEGQSNYNTRNSYDDFLEIEKNIRKSVRIDHLKGVGKKAKRMKTNDDQYVGRIVDCLIIRRDRGDDHWAARGPKSVQEEKTQEAQAQDRLQAETEEDETADFRGGR